MENNRTMDQITGLTVTLVVFLGLVVVWFTVGKRLAAGDRRVATWADVSRLAAYAGMTGPVPELELVRLGRILADEVEGYLAAQVSGA